MIAKIYWEVLLMITKDHMSLKVFNKDTQKNIDKSNIRWGSGLKEKPLGR